MMVLPPNIKRFLRNQAHRIVSRWVIFSIDMVVVLLSFLVAYLLRFNFMLTEIRLDAMWRQMMVFGLVYAAVFLVVKPFRGIVRHTSFHDAFKVFLSTLMALGVLLALSAASQMLPATPVHIRFSTAVLLIAFLASLFGLLSLRFAIKVVYLTVINGNIQQKENILIFGAGEMGMITRQTIESTKQARLRVIGFIDDNPGKVGKSIAGVPVYDGSVLNEEFLRHHRVKEVILAVNQLSTERRKQIIEKCLDYGLRVRTVPRFAYWINGSLEYKQIRKVRIEELLERQPIKLDNELVKPAMKGKTVWVTGAAGSIGSEISRQVLRARPDRLVLVDQAETPLHDLQQELRAMDKDGRVEKAFVLLDISRDCCLEDAFAEHKPDYIFHAAAYKHVPLIENNPREAIRVNVLGTHNLAQLSEKHGVERFVLVSTDKAVNPTSFMGASKRIAELLVQSKNLSDRGKTRFITTRFGNVLGSNGSVIPTFERQIASGGPVTITHPDMIRYFMTIPEACELVIEAGVMGKGGEIFVFDMGKQLRIEDVAHKMIRLSGLEPEKDIDIVYTGLRPGEKLYEELFSRNEKNEPTHHPKLMMAHYEGIPLSIVPSTLKKLVEAQLHHDHKALREVIRVLVPEFLNLAQPEAPQRLVREENNA